MAVVAAVVALYFEFAPPPPAPPESAVPVVTAIALVQEYHANEVGADRSYRGRVIEVTGRVESVRRDALDRPFVMLYTGRVLQGVQCVFPESRAGSIASLRPGDEVTIRGTCTGMTLGSIILKDCTR